METVINTMLETLFSAYHQGDFLTIVMLVVISIIVFVFYRVLGSKIGFRIAVDTAFPYNSSFLVIILFFVFFVNFKIASPMIGLCDKFGNGSESKTYYACVIAFGILIFLNLVLRVCFINIVGKKMKKSDLSYIAMPFLGATIMWTGVILILVINLPNLCLVNKSFIEDLINEITSWIVFFVAFVLPFISFMIKSYNITEILYVQRKLPIRIKTGKNKLVENKDSYKVITYDGQYRCIKEYIFPKERVCAVVKFFGKEGEESKNKDLDEICSDFVVKIWKKIKNLYKKQKIRKTMPKNNPQKTKCLGVFHKGL